MDSEPGDAIYGFKGSHETSEKGCIYHAVAGRRPIEPGENHDLQYEAG